MGKDVADPAGDEARAPTAVLTAAQTETHDDPAPDAESAAGTTERETGSAPSRPVHRLRDLDRNGRRWAVALAVAVLAAPIAALIHFLPEWTPATDPALMAIRSLDVGTSRTPMLGQPSTASAYAGAEGHVHHPGPLHFYLMAVPIRVLGGALAMPLVSVAITGSCLLVSVWAVFRQLGKAAAVLAAALLTVTAFTTGAASLINPVSSNIAGYPLLATAVLGWCVLCGDLRLLPLATGVFSFAAQQHLSVDPALAVLAAGVAGLTAWRLLRARRRHTPGAPNGADLRRWGAWSLVVALVMWSPVIVQQLFGNLGNVGQMIDFARHGNSETLGYGKATWQIANAFGLPPLLGRTNLTGWWLTASPSIFTWVSATAVLAAVATVAWRRRIDDPRVAALGTMVGLTCLAGLISGASVPVGPEQQRITFYHWAVAGAFLAALTLGVAALHPARRLLAGRAPRTARPRVALGVLAVIAVALPGLASTHLDRRANTLVAAYSGVTTDEVAVVVDSVLARRDDLGDHVVQFSIGEPLYSGVSEAIAFGLIEQGFDIRLPLPYRYFVHDQRLVDRDEVDGAVVVVVDREFPNPTPDGGELIAEVVLEPGVDSDFEAWSALHHQVEASPEPTAAEVERALSDMPEDEALLFTAIVAGIWDDPREQLATHAVLDFLAAYPDVAPTLDRELVDRVRRSLPDEGELTRAGDMTRLRIYLLDRDETLDQAGRRNLGRT